MKSYDDYKEAQTYTVYIVAGEPFEKWDEAYRYAEKQLNLSPTQCYGEVKCRRCNDDWVYDGHIYDGDVICEVCYDMVIKDQIRPVEMSGEDMARNERLGYLL